MLLRWREGIVRICVSEDGYEMLEYSLLATFIILPLTQVVPFLVDMLRMYYALVSFTFSLPFP
jgi:hypothetical protein